jgi:hypothetical protein
LNNPVLGSPNYSRLRARISFDFAHGPGRQPRRALPPQSFFFIFMLACKPVKTGIFKGVPPAGILLQ